MKRPLVVAALVLSACAAPAPLTDGGGPPSPVSVSGAEVPRVLAKSARAPRSSRTKNTRPVPPATAKHLPRPTHTRPGLPAATRAGLHWWAPTHWTLLMQHCIGSKESVSYTGIGPGGHTGHYQFSDPTFHYASGGLSGHASDWPPAVQDRAFLRLFDNGVGRHQWPRTYQVCRAIYGGPA